MPGGRGGGNFDSVKTKTPSVPYVAPANKREVIERVAWLVGMGLSIGVVCNLMMVLMETFFGGN